MVWPWWQHHLAVLGLLPWVWARRGADKGSKSRESGRRVPSSNPISALTFVLFCVWQWLSLSISTPVGWYLSFWVQKSQGPHQTVFSPGPVWDLYMIEHLLTFHLWGVFTSCCGFPNPDRVSINTLLTSSGPLCRIVFLSGQWLAHYKMWGLN